MAPHAAQSPAERASGPGRIRAVMTRVARRVFSGPVLDFAAQLAFYAVLALAPFLVVLTSLAGFLPSATAVEHLLTRARGFMPPDGFKLVSQVVHDVVDSRSATLFTVGLLTALWSASRVADALRTALNSANGLEEGRSFVRRRRVGHLPRRRISRPSGRHQRRWQRVDHRCAREDRGAYRSFANDRVDLYAADNASSPRWTLIGTLSPTAAGAQTLTTTATLTTGAVQAIRARIRYRGSAAPCGTGAFDDHDDLVFAVQRPTRP